MANNSFEFIITANNKGLKKALEESVDSAGKLENALSTALGTFGGGLAIKAIEGVGSAIKGVANFALESVDAFAEQEDAVNRLGQALRSTGGFSEEAVQGVSDFASELQKTSRFGDEAIIAQVAFVKSLGATTEQSKALVQAAANLSATLGGSLEENVDKLGKTLSGTSGRLAQYIPELKNLTEEQLRAGAAADIINQKYSGAAANDLKTYSGSVTATKNAFSDLQEELGAIIAQNSLVRGGLDLAKSAFENVTKTIVTLREEINGQDPMSKIPKSAEEAAVQITRLDEKILELKKSIEDNKIVSPGWAQALQVQLDSVIQKRNKIEEDLQFGKIKPAKTSAETGVATPDEVKKAGELRAAELRTINEQIAAEQRNFKLAQQNEEIQFESAKNIAEIERLRLFEIEKANLKKEFDLAQAQEKLTGQELVDAQAKINAENELAQIRINNEAKLKEQKLYNQLDKKAKDEAAKLDEQRLKQKEADQRDSLSTIATLQQSNNKTLAAIGKAAALTQIAIDGPVAVTKALSAFPPPFNFAAATAVAAAVTAQAARVAGVQFENGGIVGQGASVGPDNRVATIRDGEMILNANQQKNLLGMINSGNSGSGDIVIQINGREIARAIREEIRSGFVLA